LTEAPGEQSKRKDNAVELPHEIISDERISYVHGFANFGKMTAREVVNDGVRKYAVGFTGGATQVAILLEHGLITTPKNAGYRADLTQKGKRYARSIWNTHFVIVNGEAAK
jgi:hypothetical protein